MVARFGVSIVGSVLILVSLLASPALAGMGSITWGDVPTYFTLSSFTRARLEALSFFIVGLLICAAIVQGLWNYLARDFARLPRLTYPQGLALVGLWGLASVLVLTMISGARELMTPGAWEKKGLFYKLAQDGQRQILTHEVQRLDREEP